MLDPKHETLEFLRFRGERNSHLVEVADCDINQNVSLLIFHDNNNC